MKYKNRFNTTKNNVSAVFGLGPGKAVPANFLFATYICFTENNKLSPARHWVCLGQGEKCYCSVFCRHCGMQPVTACPTGLHHLQLASFLAASSFLGWGTSSSTRTALLQSSPTMAFTSSVTKRMPSEQQADGESHPAPAVLSSNPSTLRGKVMCFFMPGFPQE